MKPIFISIAIIFSLALSFRGIEEYKDYKFRAHWSEYQEKGATGEQLNKIRSYYLNHGKLLYLDINK